MAIIASMANLFFNYFDYPLIISTPSSFLSEILYYIYNNPPTISVIATIKVLIINPAYKYAIVPLYSYTILVYIVGAPSAEGKGIIKDRGSMEGGEVYRGIYKPISF
jgi:hypothetical protein